MQEVNVLRELPRYKCHKEVFALRIVNVRHTDASVFLDVEEPYAPIEVGTDWWKKHGPQQGGYWVRYEDGYTSYSPEKAFESGYSRILPKPSPRNRLLRWLETNPNLAPHLKAIAAPIQAVGEQLDAVLDEGAEKTAGIRKLIEAKDCLVRARIEMGS